MDWVYLILIVLMPFMPFMQISLVVNYAGRISTVYVPLNERCDAALIVI